MLICISNDKEMDSSMYDSFLRFFESYENFRTSQGDEESKLLVPAKEPVDDETVAANAISALTLYLTNNSGLIALSNKAGNRDLENMLQYWRNSWRFC